MAHARFRLALICMTTALVWNGAAAVPAAQTPQADILSTDATGFTVRLSFPEPVLNGGADPDGGAVLRVDIPGAVPDFNGGAVVLPELLRLVEVPDGFNLSARVVSRSDLTYDLQPVLPRDAAGERLLRSTGRIPAVEVGTPGWMRYRRVVPVVIRPARLAADGRQLISTGDMVLEFRFTPGGERLGAPPDPERYRSLAFEQLFDALLLNRLERRVIPPGGEILRRGSYLIITDEALARVAANFAEWKRSKGFDVQVEPVYHLNETHADDIRAFIRDAFDNWERPPEFVLLLGDANAAGIKIPPAEYIRNPKPGVNENDATDQPYGYLVGDDYFPDLFIGRISADSPSPGDALSALNRYIKYERDLLDDEDLDINAFSRATLWAGNFSDSGPVRSPVETCMWLADRLQEFNYDVEEFYWRDQRDPLNPSPIIESINRGVNIVAYRGWADANGTHYPQFYKQHLDQLTNGPLLPVFTIFVCNTGDYANDRIQPCFGEYSVTRGSQREARAALAFYGPSDLHTSTKYNNPMLAGYYTGLMYENIRGLGPLTQRAKLQVWAGFPDERGTDQDNFVEFYYSVYNITGDPDVNVYFNAPHQLEVEHPDTLFTGDTYTRFSISAPGGAPVKGAVVTLRKGEETEVSVLTDADGLAYVPVNLESTGELEATVIARQAVAFQTEIPVVEPERLIAYDGVQVANGEGDGRLLTGAPVDLAVTLRNLGRDAAGEVSATLTSPMGNIEIQQGDALFGDIAAGGSADGDQPYRVELSSWFRNGHEVPFILDITTGDGGEYRALFRLAATAGGLMLRDYSIQGGSIAPGESRELVIAVDNYGDLDLDGVHGVIHSHDEAVVVDNADAEFGAIPAHSVVDCAADPFQISIREGTYIGRRIQLRTVLYDGQDRQVGYIPFYITVGEVNADDPVGPDGYGYFAYEDIDDSDRYPQTPRFDWVELDPRHGGEGAERYEIADDTVAWAPLPFTFTFYGEDYDSITICDNGWLAFGVTWMNNFRNWGLPSPLGPHSMVAPFWDDLTRPDPDNPDDPRRRTPVEVFTRYDRDEGRFIVEWSRAVNRRGLENQDYRSETFEVILYDPEVHRTATGDGEMLFQYLEVDNVDNANNFATVGIQDRNHRRGLEVTFAGEYPASADTLRPQRAIKITTEPPDDYLETRETATGTPEGFALREPYPNPFNAAVRLRFVLPHAMDVELTIHDIAGRRVRTVTSGTFPAGSREVTFDAAGLPNGVYLVRLQGAGMTAQRKMLLLK